MWDRPARLWFPAGYGGGGPRSSRAGSRGGIAGISDCPRQGSLRREAGAALVAARLQDRAAGPRPHAGAEAVLALAASGVGLIGPLGHQDLVRSSIWPRLARSATESRNSWGLVGVRRSIAEVPFFLTEPHIAPEMCVVPGNGLTAAARVRLRCPGPEASREKFGGQDCGTSPPAPRRAAPLASEGCPHLWIRLWTGAKDLLRPAFCPRAASRRGFP